MAAGQCPAFRGSPPGPQKQDALPLEPGPAPLLSGLSLGCWDPPSAAPEAPAVAETCSQVTGLVVGGAPVQTQAPRATSPFGL